MSPLRLQIGPVIAQASALHARAENDLPGHVGLAGLAAAAAAAAREAERVSRQLKRPWSLHRSPPLFLAAALLLLVGWMYLQFFHVTTLTVAVPDRDAQQLRGHITRDRQIRYHPVIVPGSSEAAERVARGQVDLAFVQGGIHIPTHLARLRSPESETVLWFIRASLPDAASVHRVLTSVAHEGSHAVAEEVFGTLRPPRTIRYLHDWSRLTEDESYVIPDDVDAAFVVKDLADDKTLRGVDRLVIAGFRIAPLDLGARANNLDYLAPAIIPARYLRNDPACPAAPVATYSVATYLVARQGLTPRLLAAASHVFDNSSPAIASRGFEPTVGETSEVFQGIDALLGILINIGLAFLALLGWETLAYRRRFHELNTLVSLISMHQSNKDVLGVTDPAMRRKNVLYLSLCSDLLGLVSMISGYYTQENPSLLFTNLSEIVHQRCDGLKINIQLKILHATIDSTGLESPVTAPRLEGSAPGTAPGSENDARSAVVDR
jgi:hypothetical protein